LTLSFSFVASRKKYVQMLHWSLQRFKSNLEQVRSFLFTEKKGHGNFLMYHAMKDLIILHENAQVKSLLGHMPLGHLASVSSRGPLALGHPTASCNPDRAWANIWSCRWGHEKRRGGHADEQPRPGPELSRPSGSGWKQL
jgi:hypothetical protein